MRRRRQSGFGLIEMVVVIAIIALLVGVYFGLAGHLKQGEKSIPGRAMDKGKEVVCQNNLQQIRSNVQLMMIEGGPPASLQEAASGLGDDFMRCPVGGEAYVYDPQTGAVYCPHPGHERY